jgi:uncharacterized OsmC-like protein
MKFSARVQNSEGKHEVFTNRGEDRQTIEIAPRPGGFGSSVSGGELLFLALATCYCNDIYREAEKRGIKVEGVEVQVNGDFDAVGAPAKNVSYRAKVIAQASEADIEELMLITDTIAEIQNTLRMETTVVLREVHAVSRR